MSEIILETRLLTTYLRVEKQTYKVVDGLNFTLEKKKTLAIVGESGCGKTMAALSLLKILPSAALTPTGEVLFEGTNLLELSESKLRKIRGSTIAMIFQDPGSALNPVYPIGDQLLEAVDLHLNLEPDLAKQKVLQVLEEVGVPFAEERCAEYPHQLSGGLKQRVMIAMALICQPKILIADEPTTALDVTIQAQVLDLIRRLQKDNDMALLLITHDMGIVAEMADDVIVMYASQAVEQGNVHDIFDKMAHPYTKGLFESRSYKTRAQGKLKPIKGSVPSLKDYPQGCRFRPRCPYAMNKCHQEVPNFAVQGNSKHLSRCWLHDGTAESTEKLLQIGSLDVNTST